MIRTGPSLFLFGIFVILFSFPGRAQQASTSLADRPFVNNPSIPAVHDGKEIYAGPYSFHPDFPEKERQWTGQWIWLNQQSYQQFQRTRTAWINPSGSNKEYRALFRKTFMLSAIPRNPILYITGDVRYHVYINGSLAGDGPVNTGGDYGDVAIPNYWYYSVLDARKWLKPGRNTIAVEVFSWALEGSDVTSSQGRLRADLRDGEKYIVSTDGFWKAIADTSYRYQQGYLQYDAAVEPDGWKTGGFNDGSWPSTSIKAWAPDTRLFRSNIPALTDFPLQPVAVYAGTVNSSPVSNDLKETGAASFYGTHAASGQYVLDFSRNRAARICFDIEASTGDTVEIIPFEKWNASSARSYRYICKSGNNSFRSTNVCIFRYLQVRLVPKKTMRVHAFSAGFSTYPVRYEGAFSCSDDFYTRLWSIARYSTQLCMSDMYFDSPMHQEPIGCTGDYFIESMNSYYAFGDHWLTRQNLIQTAQLMEKNDYKMFHTSYSLLWVQMLRQYYLHTGDVLLVKQLLPDADKLMQRFHRYLNKDYLVAEAPNYMFMDWITIRGYNVHHPPAMIGMGYLSTMLYKAMMDIDDLRTMIGAGEDQPRYSRQADSIKYAINQLLWDKDRHLYKDGIPFLTHVKPQDWLPADSNLTTYSAHVNTLAVLYGIAPREEWNPIMDYVASQKEYELQPYFMSYVLGAVHQTGRTDLALDLMERWRGGVDTTTWTLKENWQDRTESGYGGDFSHAWGGAALRWLSQDVLGVSPDKPGFERIAIHPYQGQKISWARGEVPVGANGKVGVDWKKEGNGYTFVYTIPPHSSAIFCIPGDSKGQWEADGKKLTPGSDSVLLNGGIHRITVR